jgi:hypothetical protein
MKKINLLFVALLGAMTLTLTSCDDCKDVTCENGGTCAEGVCECPADYYGDMCEVHCVNGSYASGACGCEAGYEGDACDVESRADMLAKYGVTDNCSASGQSTYECTIASSSIAVDGVLIGNFWGVFVNDVKGTVSGDKITIAEQDPDSDGYKVSGSGTITGTTFDFSYSIIDPAGEVDNCTGTWTKK